MNLVNRLFGRRQATPAADTFGPFDPMFQSGDYLVLLSLTGERTPPALKRLHAIMQSTGDPGQFIVQMLAGRDWRPHLVAALAVILSRHAAHYVPELWRTFDAGSWAAPQLAVTLFVADPSFSDTAKERIAGRCGAGLALPSEPGADSVRARNLAALLQMLGHTTDAGPWLSRELAAVDVKALLRADRDRVGDIADAWWADLQQQFAHFGWALTSV